MKIQEYIESGILEAYVLDALPKEEQAKVQANIAAYPELANEVDAIEEAMLRFNEADAIQPPAGLQDKIWNAIKLNDRAEAPVTKPQTKTIPLTAAPRERSWLRAAIWVALGGSLLANAMLMYQRSESVQQQTALARQVDTLKTNRQQLAIITARYNTLENQYRKEKEMVADPAMQTVVMHSLKKEHPMAATIYWSKGKGEAYIAISKLPEPPKGMQYQLWVMQDGKPVDMGVLPNELVSNDGMQRMNKSVTSGQAFAISLEKEGGSPVPTMENIYVMGKVAS